MHELALWLAAAGQLRRSGGAPTLYERGKICKHMKPKKKFL
jgi:hypothetical protein